MLENSGLSLKCYGCKYQHLGICCYYDYKFSYNYGGFENGEEKRG